MRLGEREIVGGHQSRHSGVPDQLEQLVEDVCRRGRIEVAGRLVRQQQPGRIGQRARDGGALLLAS